jgi:hypothetical protein
VPGISLTSIRSSRSKRLTSEDLPAFGRPTIATATSLGFVADSAPLPDGNARTNRVEQVSYAVTMFGSDLEYRIESELIHLQRPIACATVVDLVDRKQRRFPRLPYRLGDLAIASGQPFSSIHHQHKEIGVSYRAPATFEHQFMQRVFAGTEHSSRICQLESGAFPLDRLRQHVPRCSRNGRDNGATRPRHAVEEGRFPNVRAADQHDRRQRPGHVFAVVDRLSDLFL